MAMNKSQQEYAKKRIMDLADKKIKEICKKHTIPAITLDDSQKWDLIKSGKVVMDLGIRPSYYTRLFDMYDFSGHTREESLDVDGDFKVKEVRQQAQVAIDTIMLGDAEEALAIIQNF